MIELLLPDGARLECELADTFRRRFLGLMGRKPPPAGHGMLLAPGGSIHTALMRFPIDVAFVAADGTVLRVAERVPPWRFRKAPRRTRFVVEVPSGEAGAAFAPGDRLEPVGRGWPARRGLLALIAAALAVLALAVPASGSVPGALGDQAAIGYYRDRAAAYARIPGVKIVETGYFFVRPAGGSAVDYSWGNGRPAGYRPATATIVARLSGGKIVAYLASLRAHGIPVVRIAMSGGAVFSSTSSCWKKVGADASPLGTGDAFLMNDGGAHYGPLAKQGRDTVTTFTYAWVRGATAVEKSAFQPRDPAPFTVRIVVRGSEKLTIDKSVTPLTGAPKLPVAPPPQAPDPKPICAT